MDGLHVTCVDGLGGQVSMVVVVSPGRRNVTFSVPIQDSNDAKRERSSTMANHLIVVPYHLSYHPCILPSKGKRRVEDAVASNLRLFRDGSS
jgi:hypothetical protein